VIRLLADANLSRKLVRSCLRLDKKFPFLYIAGWLDGRRRISDEALLLEVLRESGLVLVSFDRRTMAKHADELTRAGMGHADAIVFRRNVSPMDCGKQSRLLVEFWRETADEEWSDRIEYLQRYTSVPLVVDYSFGQGARASRPS